jgi:transcriptional regulator with XRE-family HTH domain
MIAGLSKIDVCKNLDVSICHYNKIESNSIEPELDFIKRFSILTGITVNYILGIIDEPLPIMGGKDLKKRKHSS